MRITKFRNQSTRKDEQPVTRRPSHQASLNRRETRTWRRPRLPPKKGVGRQTPTPPVVPRGKANALAALRAKRQLQRHNHACRARLLVALGRPRTFALANCRRKSWHSSDHRPPTSQANTTKRERPNRPANSGYVASFLCLALAWAAHSGTSRAC